MSVGASPMPSGPPSPMLAPEDMRVQKPVEFSAPPVLPGGVVEVRQAEVVAVLVREHAEAAVLGLDRVVADPDAGRVVRDHRRERRPTGADRRSRR